MAFAGGMIKQRDGGAGIPLRELERTIRGSLWLPSQETVQVCHVDLQRSQVFLFLICLDEELAAQAQGAGCSCGSVLHRSNYPHKPRSCPIAAVRDAFSSRLSNRSLSGVLLPPAVTRNNPPHVQSG